MHEAGLDALVCALPSSVLLLSGYWPVVGNAVVVFTKAEVVLLVPAQELSLTKASWADSVETYEPGSLEHIYSLTAAIEPLLKSAMDRLDLHGCRIGIETGPWVQPAPYVALSNFGSQLQNLIMRCAAASQLVPVDDSLKKLQSVQTDREIASTQASCDVAERAFGTARELIRDGTTEMQVAGQVRARLMEGNGSDDRCDGFAFCMSGPNASKAYKFYAHTRHRKMKSGDLVLVHCNSYVNGFWTDVTRTFHLGPLTPRAREMYEAVFAARAAALAIIRPGVKCAEVDHAARSVLAERGFGKQFKHPLGHGVGFFAMDAQARPMLHPVSTDVLKIGMVFNVEPAIYFDGECGMRHCDMVACTAEGHRLLTDFYSHIDELVIA